MPTVDLPGIRSISTDSAFSASDRSSARPVTFAYFTPASGLNSNVVTTGPGVNLDDGAGDRELVALLLEQPGGVHQLALVDLLLALRRVEQRERRQREAVAAASRSASAPRVRAAGGRRADFSARLAARGGRGDRRRRRRAVGLGRRRPRPRLRRRAGGAAAGRAASAGACGGRRRALGGLGLRGLHLVGVLRRVLLDDLPALLLAAPAPRAGPATAAERAGTTRRRSPARSAEKQPAERELRGEDQRREEQRQDDDDRAGAVEGVGEPAREDDAQIRRRRAFDRPTSPERQGQQRADAREQQRGADELRVDRVDRPAPEQVPADDAEQRPGTR